MVEEGFWANQKKRPGGFRFRVRTGLLVPGPSWQTNLRGDFNRRINEMRAWCRSNVGREVLDWNLREMSLPQADGYQGREVCFLFHDSVVATGFMLVHKRAS
ncbi:MAG: hypothetical protein EOP83_01680 [Verrucomicrobiaceae bacterium]|nr:MAG: hypothetical protein EOP83_01680 [Verrucomicrobiaceae bacterium]